MPRNTATITFSGLEDLSAVLRGISADMRASILEPALVKAAEPIRAAMAGFAPIRSGALARSIAIKGISNKSTGTAAALIGPDRNYYRAGVKLKKGDSYRGADRPANYAHLIEFGHVNVQPKKGTTRRKGNTTEVGFTPARPFLRPGLVAGAAAANEILVLEIGKSIDSTRRRLVKRGEHSVAAA